MPTTNGKRNNHAVLKKHKEQFRRRKPWILDHGNLYSFPQLPLLEKMPAGLYQPATTRNGEFMLRRVSPVNQAMRISNQDVDTAANKSSMNINPQEQEELNDFIAELEAALQDDGETVANTSTIYHYFGQELEYLSDGYFQLEKYNTGLKHISNDIERFLTQRDFYKKNHLNYKRNLLLYGAPGTGKSRFIDNLSRKLINSHDAVVIRMDSTSDLNDIMSGLPELEFFLEGQLKIIIIEEIAELVGSRKHASDLLNLLDNQILRNNIMFFMTTNFPERVPDSIINRPSRVDCLVNIDNTSNQDGFIEAWYQHITGSELDAKYKNSEWYMKKLSPAYLKELFVFAQLHGIDLDESWKEIQRRLEEIDKNFESTSSIGFMRL